jgi:hypothetical protein
MSKGCVMEKLVRIQLRELGTIRVRCLLPRCGVIVEIPW